MRKKTVVIAGGGTGGHVYPGIALAENLKRQNSDIEVHFVGATGGLEERIVPKHGYPLHLLKVDRLHSSVGIFRRLKTLLLLPVSFFQSLYLYLKLRPQWVLGIGGFASGPFVFTSSLLGGKTAVLEPNAYPGMANRYLAKVVRHCFVVFEETKRFFPSQKVKVVGLPVRLQKKSPPMTYKGDRPFRILVFGGSQGARAVNQIVGDWVAQLATQDHPFEIMHQVGARDFSIWEKTYADKYSSFLTYKAYIDNMPEMLDWADLIICRSGVGSVVEVAMAGKVAIFVPLPTAADNHQVKNAQVLVDKGAGFMIEQKDLDWQKLHAQVESLQKNPDKLQKCMDQLVDFDFSQAPQQIISALGGVQ